MSSELHPNWGAVALSGEELMGQHGEGNKTSLFKAMHLPSAT